jgi:hypothetical protein
MQLQLAVEVEAVLGVVAVVITLAVAVEEVFLGDGQYLLQLVSSEPVVLVEFLTLIVVALHPVAHLITVEF